MVGMAVRDQRALDRHDRVDMKIAGRAIKPARRGEKEVGRAHGPAKIGMRAGAR
jgi:hypothetical protein